MRKVHFCRSCGHTFTQCDCDDDCPHCGSHNWSPKGACDVDECEHSFLQDRRSHPSTKAEDPLK